jgi:hypothetical protein
MTRTRQIIKINKKVHTVAKGIQAEMFKSQDRVCVCRIIKEKRNTLVTHLKQQNFTGTSSIGT